MIDTMRAIFLHHSVGGSLIRDGRARELLRAAAPNIELWDHGYDATGIREQLRMRARNSPAYGLRDGSGKLQSSSWGFPDNNTDPNGLEKLFRQPVSTPPNNALSHLLSFDVIIFKSCYTAASIGSDTRLQTHKDQYLTIRDTIDRYPQKLFIPMTPPPLRASLTKPEDAARARRFADWMHSDAFTGGRSNIAVYDFFDALAAPSSDGAAANTLHPRWCLPDTSDSHPNDAANQAIAPVWVEFVVQAVRKAEFLKPALVR